jgi:hypothetical protein
VNPTRATDRIPAARNASHRMYYRSPSAAVTEEWFVTPNRTFSVAGLHQIRTARVGVTWRFRPRSFEIWAEYNGVVVRIYESADEKTFGHVCRALIRARDSDARSHESD